MKFEIKPIEIKEEMIIIDSFIDTDEYIPEEFEEDAKEYDGEIKEFKKNESEKLFDYLYNHNKTTVVNFTPHSQIEYEHEVQLSFKIETKEVVIETITPEIKSAYAFKDIKVYNYEILKQLKKELEIAEIDPFKFNVSFDEKQKFDVFVFYKKNGYAHKVYGIVHRKNKGLTNSMLALLADDNLCFGFRLGDSGDINENFKYQEIIIQTD